MSREAMQIALDMLEESSSLFVAMLFEKRSEDEIEDQVLANRKAIETLRAALAQPEKLPHWEPCNPGCDPDFNGKRSLYCADLCHNARTALAPPELDRIPFPECNMVRWGEPWYSVEQMKKYAEKCANKAIYEILQKKKWVGLTDEEIERIFVWQEWNDDFADFEPVTRAIEAKLKEKNT